MRRTLPLILAVSLVCIFVAGCGTPGAGNAGNATANTANSANNAAKAPAASAAAIEAEVKKLANDGITAIKAGDTAALDKLWADNYVFIAQDGTVATKAQRLDALKSGQSKIESLAYDEMTVRSNAEGTGAILVGVATVKGTNMGKPVDGRMRFTQVWSKMPDGWRSVHGQVTAISGAPSAPPAANAPATGSNTANSRPTNSAANTNR